MKVAVVQMDVAYADPHANATKIADHLRALGGTDLVIFPECALTGYAAATEEQARRLALPWPWTPSLAVLQTAVEASASVAVVGLAGVRGDGSLANVAAILSPGEAPRFYEKTHLPFLGYDRFARAGDELPVFDLAFGRLGVMVCYDQRFPEATRKLALEGVDLIALPTNWPVGAETSADHISIARAAENKIFVATANRVGQEGGFRFIGRSKIISPIGKVLAAAGDGEEVICATLNLAEARQKRTVNIPGEYEIDVIGHRRPELYE